MGLRWILAACALLAACGPSADQTREPSVAAAAIDPPGPAGPIRTFKDCDFCPEMVIVPAGSFTMGSPDDEPGRRPNEGPQRRVSVQSFAVAKFEITNAEWRRCVERRGCNYTVADQRWRPGGEPVSDLFWSSAQDFVRWLSRETGRPYRLLTEAEWEFAARGGDRPGPYWWGPIASHDFANYGIDKCGWGGCNSHVEGRDRWEKWAPPGFFPANPFGLHDMHGNEREWVQDCYAKTYDGVRTDGGAHEERSCKLRVLRGGSWFSDATRLRSAHRFPLAPNSGRRGDGGIRVARTLDVSEL